MTQALWRARVGHFLLIMAACVQLRRLELPRPQALLPWQHLRENERDDEPVHPWCAVCSYALHAQASLHHMCRRCMCCGRHGTC